MKLFELYENTTLSCLIIGGHHGNEPIGIDICKKLIDLLPAIDSLHIIPIANRPAFVANEREFNGINLNRAYGEQPTNIPELDSMVETIKSKASQATVVIDCHSTPIKDLQEIAVFPNKSGANTAPLMGLPFYFQPAPEGSLRYFCDEHGVPCITFEGVDELHGESVEAGVAGILQLLNAMKII